MAIIGVDHSTLTSNRGPSPRIWGKIPLELWRNFEGGFLFEDHFVNFASSSTAQAVQGYTTYIDTSVTINQHITEDGGVVSMIHDGTDNDEASIGIGGNIGGLCKITSLAIKTLAFEARIKKSAITDEGIGFACGLAAVGSAVADILVNDTGALKDQAWLTFRGPIADGDGITVEYKKVSQTLQTLIAAGAAGMPALVADTYIKLGFLVDPQAPAAKRITFFVDNVELTTYLTDTQIAAATFPSGVSLAPIFANKIGTATASLATQIDWWRLAGSYTVGV